jgi:hypothetical protein
MLVRVGLCPARRLLPTYCIQIKNQGCVFQRENYCLQSNRCWFNPNRGLALKRAQSVCGSTFGLQPKSRCSTRRGSTVKKKGENERTRSLMEKWAIAAGLIPVRFRAHPPRHRVGIGESRRTTKYVPKVGLCVQVTPMSLFIVIFRRNQSQSYRENSPPVSQKSSVRFWQTAKMWRNSRHKRLILLD